MKFNPSGEPRDPRWPRGIWQDPVTNWFATKWGRFRSWIRPPTTP